MELSLVGTAPVSTTLWDPWRAGSPRLSSLQETSGLRTGKPLRSITVKDHFACLHQDSIAAVVIPKCASAIWHPSGEGLLAHGSSEEAHELCGIFDPLMCFYHCLASLY